MASLDIGSKDRQAWAPGAMPEVRIMYIMLNLITRFDTCP
jgi:hypothetical protein